VIVSEVGRVYVCFPANFLFRGENGSPRPNPLARGDGDARLSAPAGRPSCPLQHCLFPCPRAPCGSRPVFGDLLVPDGASRAAEIREFSAVYATRARGEGTKRAYRSAWSGFEAWCALLGREPLAGDPDTLAMYAVHLADRGLAGIALDLRRPRLVMVL
jgi:hypothetical protein